MRISDWSSDVGSSDLARQRNCGAQVDERIIVEAPGVARIVIALARPAQRRADFESEAEGIARRGIGAVARTARQPVAETGAAFGAVFGDDPAIIRSEEHTSELQSLMRISYAVFCLKKKKYTTPSTQTRELGRE